MTGMEKAMESDNLWSSILREVQSRSSASLPQASVLVLGDAGSGKSSLVARLQRKETERTGAGMEYHYLEVNPDFKDGTYAYQLGSALGDPAPGESGRLGVWVMGSETELSPLLRFPLSPALLPNSAALLCVSLAQPWTIMESLRRWSKLLETFVSEQDGRLVAQCREAQVRFWQEYVEPLDSSSHSDAGAKVPSMETDAVLLPLSDSVLKHNVGIPIIVVLTHSDRIPELSKEYGLKDEQLDFIQSHLRHFCLSFGAALFYTSAKEGRNCEELYKYLLHRLFSFPFTRPASVIHRDSVVIPAGWDNEKKLNILHEQLRSIRPNDLFEEHVKKPVLRRPQPKEADVTADEDQAFLARAQTLLAQQPKQQTNNPAQDSPSHNPPRVVKTASVTPTTTPKLGEAGKTPTLPSSQSVSGEKEGVLAHFFNNLLTQKAGTAGARSPNVNGEDLSESQKAAELSRMVQARSASSDPNSNSHPESTA